jgi:hypothetical protein
MPACRGQGMMERWSSGVMGSKNVKNIILIVSPLSFTVRACPEQSEEGKVHSSLQYSIALWPRPDF